MARDISSTSGSESSTQKACDISAAPTNADSEQSNVEGEDSDSESSNQSAQLESESDSARELPSATCKSSRKAKKKKFTIIDKVNCCLVATATHKLNRVLTSYQLHSVVIDILSSEVQRKRMHHLIQKYCDPENCHLVPIHSMRIRWNTTYAEIT